MFLTIGTCRSDLQSSRLVDLCKFGVEQYGGVAELLGKYLLTQHFNPSRSRMSKPSFWLALFHL